MIRILTFLALLAAPGHAQTPDDVVKLTVLHGWRAVDGTHMAGLRLDLAPGWKTYWRHPGDVGFPPVFDWSRSQNIAAVDVLWPRPKVTWDDDMRTIGYDGAVVWPLHITPLAHGDVVLNGHAQIGVCKEICIPVDLDIRATLGALGGSAGRADADIRAAIAAQPKPAQGQAICAFAPSDDGMELTLTLPPVGTGAEIVIEVNGANVWVSPPETQRVGGRVVATVDILTVDGNPIAIPRQNVVTTVLTETAAVEYRGCVGG